MASLKDEIGDFVAIPLSFIEDDHQTAESRVVFMVLRYHTNRRRKRSFPGYETIMRETGLKRNKTAEGLAVLEKTGWLVKHRQFGRASEYELRYPERHDSPTGKLSQASTIVSQADHDSPTGKLRSNSDNKIEFNKIELFAIQELKDPDSIRGLRNQMSVYEHVPYDEAYEAWYSKYEPQGGIGRRPGSKCTLAQYAARIETYFRAWERNAVSRNGHGHDVEVSGNPSWMAPLKPVGWVDETFNKP